MSASKVDALNMLRKFERSYMAAGLDDEAADVAKIFSVFDELIKVATSVKNALAIIANSEESDTSDKFHQLFFDDLPALRAAIAQATGEQP